MTTTKRKPTGRTLVIRFADDEFKMLNSLAEFRDLPLSTFIKDLAFAQIEKEMNIDAWLYEYRTNKELPKYSVADLCYE